MQWEVEGKVAGGLLNVGAKAEAGSAQGRLAVHFEDRNNYTIGFKGSASAASASMDISSSLLSMRTKEDDKPVELFGFAAEPKAKKGASATAMLSSKTVYEIGRVNIHATTLELGGAIGLGINLRLTIPSISFDFW